MADKYTQKLTGGLTRLRDDRSLTDFTIHAGNQDFCVHKLVLMSLSDYFLAMLSGEMTETQTSSVRLEGFSAEAVQAIINYMYTGVMKTEEAQLDEILGCAVYLQIQPAIEDCVELLLGGLTNDNCFHTYHIFKTFCLDDGISKTAKVIRKQVKQMKKTWKPQDMSYEEFLGVCDFWWKSEWELFDMVNLWLSVDFEKRLPHLNDLFHEVRFGLLTPTQLLDVKKCFTYNNFEGTWRSLVDGALSYHKLSINLKVFYCSKQTTTRGRPTLVGFKAKSSYSYCEDVYLLPFESRYTGWEKVNASTGDLFDVGVVQTVVVNNFLIVCSGPVSGQKWHILSTNTMKWLKMSGTLAPREDFALVHHEQSLYVLGGLCIDRNGQKLATNSIERYNFNTGSWMDMSTVLPMNLSGHCACTLGDCIYIAGSVELEPDELSQYFYCYNVAKDTWQKTTGVDIYKKNPWKMVQMEVGGEKVLLLVSYRLRVKYYSPSSGQWVDVDTYQLKYQDDDVVPEESYINWCKVGNVITRGNTIYFLNFDYQALHADRAPRNYKRKNQWWKYMDTYRGACLKCTLTPPTCPAKKAWVSYESQLNARRLYGSVPGQAKLDIQSLERFPVGEEQASPSSISAMLTVPAQFLK